MEGTIEEQRIIEEEHRSSTVAKYMDVLRTRMSQGKFSTTDEGSMLMRLIYLPYEDKVKEYKDATVRGQGGVYKNILFELVPSPSAISFIVISKVLDKIARRSIPPTLASVGYAVGTAIVTYASTELVKTHNPKLYSYLHHVFKGASKERLAKIIEDHSTDLYDVEIDNDTVVAIGIKLVELLVLSGVDLITVVKALRNKHKSGVNVVRLTPNAIEVLNRYAKGLDFTNKINPPPMIVPPKDWHLGNDGGFITIRTSLLKHVKGTSHYKDIHRLMGVINKMQRVAWRVNSRVADVMADVLEYNIPDPTISSNIPRVIGGLPISTPPDIDTLIKKENYGKLDADGFKFVNTEDFFKYNRAKEEMEIKLDSDASRRLSINLTLATANKVIDYDKIYFTYSLDYRGRIYAISPFLSPQGPSYSKALLEFAEGQYLDDVGLYWLKIHLANEYGHDKLPYSERIQWVDNNIAYIYDAGKSPMDHISFWAYADKPYEFLSACFGMYDHMNDKPVHTGVQLDATCSGIQIYSGLLLDKVGAEAVNVIGGDRNDIYQQVADKVNHYLHTGDYPKSYEFKDKEGVDRVVTTKEEAESLAGKITRKLTKRNTMTLPYSVTLRGMYDQLREEFKDARIQGKIFWEGDEWVATKLLADLNHRAIYEVVEGARLGQEYLKEVGNSLANTDDIVEYVTPIYNFKVVQKSYKQKKKRVKTYFGSLVLRTNTDEVDRRAQVNGIAPNVIHSLDATLLFLTVEKQLGAIGTNHDCFTVPPNDAEVLGDNFRVAYKEVMECSPLAFIGKQLDSTVEVPHIGSLDLEDVLEAKYIIS